MDTYRTVLFLHIVPLGIGVGAEPGTVESIAAVAIGYGAGVVFAMRFTTHAPPVTAAA